MSESDKNSPLVTVIIPCHNHGKTVMRAIKSIAEQTYANKRVFVSDEGSEDDTLDVLTSPAFYDDDVLTADGGHLIGHIDGMPVHIFKVDKGDGPSPARNRLIKAAWEDTDYFAILDADDYYMPTKLEKTVEVMSYDPDIIGLVYNDAIIHNDKTGSEVYEYREPYNRSRIERECITSNTPLLNKAALQKIGLYDEEMRTAEDWDLALRITQDFVAIHVPEALHVYSVTGQNASDIVDKEIWNQNWMRIRQKIHRVKHAQ